MTDPIKPTPKPDPVQDAWDHLLSVATAAHGVDSAPVPHHPAHPRVVRAALLHRQGALVGDLRVLRAHDAGHRHVTLTTQRRVLGKMLDDRGRDFGTTEATSDTVDLLARLRDQDAAELAQAAAAAEERGGADGEVPS